MVVAIRLNAKGKLERRFNLLSRSVAPSKSNFSAAREACCTRGRLIGTHSLREFSDGSFEIPGARQFSHWRSGHVRAALFYSVSLQLHSNSDQSTTSLPIKVGGPTLGCLLLVVLISTVILPTGTYSGNGGSDDIFVGSLFLLSPCPDPRTRQPQQCIAR